MPRDDFPICPMLCAACAIPAHRIALVHHLGAKLVDRTNARPASSARFPLMRGRPRRRAARCWNVWLTEIEEGAGRYNQANPTAPRPFAITNRHRSNSRLDRDIGFAVKHKVPIWNHLAGARVESQRGRRTACGGIVLHDIIKTNSPVRLVEKGADGLVAVACAGAGGHAGSNRPLRSCRNPRKCTRADRLSVPIATGESLLAARGWEADLGL